MHNIVIVFIGISEFIWVTVPGGVELVFARAKCHYCRVLKCSN